MSSWRGNLFSLLKRFHSFLAIILPHFPTVEYNLENLNEKCNAFLSI